MFAYMNAKTQLAIEKARNARLIAVIEQLRADIDYLSMVCGEELETEAAENE